ncbi:serine protease [Actinoplanes sp. NBRC 14428]|nr:serine protease [Actinoplanes sp. NBRC 14428]
MHLRRLLAVALAGGTALAFAAALPHTGDAAQVPVLVGDQRADRPTTVTLITGDRVIVSEQGTAVERGPGRAGVRFMSWTSEGHRHVVPADALPLLRKGKLDQRLFDVTTLAEFGYTGGKDLPLLLAYPDGGQHKGPGTARAAVRATARLGRHLPGLDLLAVRGPRAERADLWKSLTSGNGTALRAGIEKIYLDGKRRTTLDVSVPQVGAPTAWQQGLDGAGVTVAVLDSGVDGGHPDLEGKVVASENFVPDAGADDVDGHGTHVASTIAGSGAVSGGKFRGVAPGAKLVSGKVCEHGWCPESAILAGMEWAAPRAPVVNMSLTYPDDAGTDALEEAVERLTAEHGTLFVVAAGNQGGQGRGTVGSPASADAALAVGAVDDADKLALFSSRGPRAGDGGIKPDIVAPGVNIVAAKAAKGDEGDPAPTGYTSMNGTSMATPHVAGAAAIVVQQHPGWTPRQRKTLLMGAAEPIAGADVYGQGAGRLDVARAVRQTVSADEGSLNFGFQQWPHDDDTPVTRTLTYRNGGTAPVDLTLAVEGDAGTFTLAATRLTVPAGGTASTTVTADTRGAGTDGDIGARVVATAAGDVRVEAPIVVQREVESYDVTFRHLDRGGRASENYVTFLIGLDVPNTYTLSGALPEETVRLPKGSYGLLGNVYDDNGTTFLVQPRFVVGAGGTTTLDARQGKPISITPPRKDARQAFAMVNAYWRSDRGLAGASAESTVPGDLFVAQVGPKGGLDGFQSAISSVFARWKNDEEGFRDSPYTYETSYTREKSFFTGFTKKISPSELATVKARYARAADGASTGVKYNWPVVGTVEGWTASLPFTLPFERTEYLNADGGVRWRPTFDVEAELDPEAGPERLTQTGGPAVRLEPGSVSRQDWNRAVFAPTDSEEPVTREGDRITAGMPLFGEGTGRWGMRSRTDTARTALYAGDALIGETQTGSGTFEVPAERKQYRLEMSATRSAPLRLSTRVDAAWTFSSANGETRLPLSTVLMSPELDSANAAAAGPFTVPLTVVRPVGSTAPGNRTLTAEFSADDGATWRPAAVSGTGDRRSLRVTNPSSGFVSLRLRATDTAGNTVTVTVIRAYAIR